MPVGSRTRQPRPDSRRSEDSAVVKHGDRQVTFQASLPSSLLARGAGVGAALARQTRSLQRSHGNLHVQRLVQRAPSSRVTVSFGSGVVRETYELSGETLEEVANEMAGRGEAGRGGADPMNYSYDANADDIATTVRITARLFTELPVWPNRGNRPAAERREYDRAIGVLRTHENRHVSIARTHINAMKTSLKGLSVSDLETRWGEKEAALQAAQQAYDDTSAHGENEGTIINLP